MDKQGRRSSSGLVKGKGRNNLITRMQSGQRHIHLNWSNFKLEFSGKPVEDAEAHLLQIK